MSTIFYLGVEIGTKYTKAWLFDNREGAFALRESASVLTSLADGGEVFSGVRSAISLLQEKSGVLLMTQKSDRLAFGGQGRGLLGSGLVVTAGKSPRTVLVGVSETYSLAALRKLTALFGCEVILSIHQQDELNATAQLERMIASDADLFVVAGGSNQGATKPVKSAVDNIRIIYENMPRQIKPQVVYAGNETYSPDAQAAFEGSLDAHIAGNLQPEIGVENQTVAWQAMLDAWRRIKCSELSGLKEVESLLATRAQPSMFATGRVLRLLDQMNPKGKGILALDLGQNEARVITARKDKLIGFTQRTSIDPGFVKKTRKYLIQPREIELLEAALLNRDLLPGKIPANQDEAEIEQATARVRINQVLRAAQELYPDFGLQSERGLTTPFEPIILSGSAFCELEDLSQVFLMAMDGFLPCGITTFVLDQYQLTAILGALAPVEPLVTVQVIDSGIFLNLGTLVGVESPERIGKKVLEVEVDENLPERRRMTVLKGDLKRIETFAEEKTRIYLSPVYSSNVGMGMSGLGGWLEAYGAQVGIVIDARGRPLELSDNDSTRVRQLKEWTWELSR